MPDTKNALEGINRLNMTEEKLYGLQNIEIETKMKYKNTSIYILGEHNSTHNTRSQYKGQYTIVKYIPIHFRDNLHTY